MPEVTINKFASDVGVPLERLQEQLLEAGLSERQAGDIITDSEKSELLAFLRKRHGKEEDAEPRKITLRRKTVSELKVPVAGPSRSKPRSKTVSIEFRKRRTYAKRGEIEEKLRQEEEAAAPPPRRRQSRKGGKRPQRRPPRPKSPPQKRRNRQQNRSRRRLKSPRPAPARRRRAAPKPRPKRRRPRRLTRPSRRPKTARRPAAGIRNCMWPARVPGGGAKSQDMRP